MGKGATDKGWARRSQGASDLIISPIFGYRDIRSFSDVLDVIDTQTVVCRASLVNSSQGFAFRNRAQR